MASKQGKGWSKVAGIALTALAAGALIGPLAAEAAQVFHPKNSTIFVKRDMGDFAFPLSGLFTGSDDSGGSDTTYRITLMDSGVTDITYSNDGEMMYLFDPNEEGTAVFSITAADEASWAEALLYVNIVDNLPPMPAFAQPSGPVTVRSGAEKSIDLSGLFEDAEGDALTYSIGSDGEATYLFERLDISGDSLLIEPKMGVSGEYPVVIRAVDAAGSGHYAEVELLFDIDNPPVQVGAPSLYVPVGTVFDLDLHAFMMDPEEDAFVFSPLELSDDTKDLLVMPADSGDYYEDIRADKVGKARLTSTVTFGEDGEEVPFVLEVNIFDIRMMWDNGRGDGTALYPIQEDYITYRGKELMVQSSAAGTLYFVAYVDANEYDYDYDYDYGYGLHYGNEPGDGYGDHSGDAYESGGWLDELVASNKALKEEITEESHMAAFRTGQLEAYESPMAGEDYLLYFKDPTGMLHRMDRSYGDYGYAPEGEHYFDPFVILTDLNGAKQGLIDVSDLMTYAHTLESGVLEEEHVEEYVEEEHAEHMLQLLMKQKMMLIEPKVLDRWKPWSLYRHLE